MPPHIPTQRQNPSTAAAAAGAATAAPQQQHQQQVRSQHSQLQQPQEMPFVQQPQEHHQLEQQQQHQKRTSCGSGVAANSILSSFDAFAFDAPKTPQRITPRKAAAKARGGAGPHRTRSPLARNSICGGSSCSSYTEASSNTSSRGDPRSNSRDNITTGGNSNNSSNSSRSAIELQRESELSPGVRLSLEWLEEAERRRGLSSTEVAAAFRCPLCHQFTMTFRSGRYGMFLGCNRYPDCQGKISGAKVEKWRCCTGNSSSSNGIRIFCELEDPHTFRLHAAGCTDTGVMLADALPRIIQTAAKAYARQQQLHQEQQQQEDNCSIPDFLRPISWLPRSDRIKSDEAMLRQFSDAAVAHAVAVESAAIRESDAAEATAASAAVGVAALGGADDRTAGASGCGAAASAGAAASIATDSAAARMCSLGRTASGERLRFVDWSKGCLEAPGDGLKYNDGCVFPLAAYPFVLQATASVCGWAALTPIPSLTLRFFREVWGPGKYLVTSKQRALDVAWWLLPSRLRQHLLPFQWEGLAYALQRGGRAIIGDEMGLGKTVQAIACIAVYRQFPCLIVVPASMRLAWADALEEWLPEYSGPPNLRVLFASGDRPSPEEKHLICLSSFEMAARLYDTLKATQYKLVVVDEAHKLRGPAIPRAASYTASEAAAIAAGAATAAETETAAAEVTTPPDIAADDCALAPTSSAATVPCNEPADLPMSQKPQQQNTQKQQPERSPRKRKNWRPPGSGQEVNKKVLDLVKGSCHALLLSGTPSVKLPADLFPLVDALLPPLEQEAAAERRRQQLQQWQQLELAAAAEAADTAASGAVAALAGEVEAPEEEGARGSAAKTTGFFVSHGAVQSPWSVATTAWRTASAAAAATSAAAAANVAGGAPAEAFGEPLDHAASPATQKREKETLVSFAEGGQARRRVGNILREERLQFAEEYCCSSRAFGSWRRFGASLRSWELHLLLTRAVLVRRRKTLRDPTRTSAQRGIGQEPPQDGAHGSSQGSVQGITDEPPGSISEGHSRQNEQRQALVGGMRSHSLVGSQRPAKTSMGGPLASLKGFPSGKETDLPVPEPQDRFKSVPLSPVDGPVLSMQDVEHLVEGLPWASQAPGDCDALVLPPCTRIVQLLLLHCNNKLVTAMGEGLLLRKPAYHSLLREAERAAADSSDSSSGDSEFDLGTMTPCNSSDIPGVAAQLTRRPPATPAERAGLCKVLSAADWLHEKFLRDTPVSSWPEEDAEEAPPKVVVFAHHRRVLDALAARLRELRMGCMNSAGQTHASTRRRQGFVRIDGTVPEDERRRRRLLFLNDPACTLALISITASSHGLDFSGASVCVFLELLPQQHELLQAESRLHRRGQRRVVTTYFLLSRCGMSSSTPCSASSRETDPLSTSFSCPISGDPLSETTEAEGEQEEEDNTSAEEREQLLLSPAFSSPLSCSRRSRQAPSVFLDKMRTEASSREFRRELRKCCMQLLQEAEAVEEAAWHRIKHQSALVQRTIDGPLATLSQLGEAQQQQQESQQQEQMQQQQEESQTFVCSSSQEEGDDCFAIGGDQQRHQSQQQRQEDEGLCTDGFSTTGQDMCCCSSLQGASQGVNSPTAAAAGGEGEGCRETAVLQPPRQQPEPSLGLPLRPLQESLAAPASESVRFRISRYTQRVHAFRGAAAVPLGISFSPADLGATTLPHSFVEQPQHQQEGKQEGPRQQLLCELQSRQSECPTGEVVRCVQEAAQQYFGLFRLLSSFEQRRVRETAWTVQNLHVYIHRRHCAQQHGSGKLDSLLDADPPEEESPRSRAKLEQQEADIPAAPVPRHTTDPLLLLQSAAATQQEHQHQQMQGLFPCLGEETVAGELHLGDPLLDTSSSSSIDPRKDSGGSNDRSPETEEDLTCGSVSSRYFSSQAAFPPPRICSREGIPQPIASTELGGGRISSRAEGSSRPQVVLVPVILNTTKAASAAGRASAASRHLQPFSLELHKVLCVSCMQPISAVSTTRTFLRVEVSEDSTTSNRLGPSQPQSCGTQGQLARANAVPEDDGNTREGPLIPALTHRAESTAEGQAVCAARGGFNRRSEVITAPQSFANDSTQRWLIRCCEQDLTCSGRCSDAYMARRRRQALRRQVERHDRGVCSNCRLDCGELLMALKMLHAAGEPQWRLEEEVIRLAPSFRAWPSLTRKLARHLTSSCAWEADHRRPVKDGGGLATVDAVQTLCKACHVEKTIEERRRRRKRRLIDTSPEGAKES
ncbi:hypothetical protein, conserved [Eimeria praecox]|uniref:Uncharacterized protein n=1 Tax=Eimeria praecox TaxID=51316 RepID=U6H901_9EIME|nr:hypothetical protein, conserved [Eimeria praecox]